MNFRHLHLQSCHSTQQVIKEQRLPGEPLLLVSTEEQSQGKGTHDRVWDFFPGSLAFSFTLEAHPTLTLTSLEIGVLIADFFSGHQLYLKWPNDLLDRKGRKVGGVLIQSDPADLTCGVGINYLDHQSTHSYRTPVGFLLEQQETPKANFQKELPKHIYKYILENRIHDSQELTDRWHRKCFHLNQPVQIQQGAKHLWGQFKGIGKQGEALLQKENTLIPVYSGSLLIKN